MNYELIDGSKALKT